MGTTLPFIFFFFPLLHISSFISCLKADYDESLDAILHDHALRVMTRQHRHTDELYNATLPEYLAGMEVSVVGLRSTTLWRKGANFRGFIIPRRTLPLPYVKRLAIVYHNLGNCSSSYYSLSGYTFLSPVVGFLAYDASHLGRNSLSRIELNTSGKPISIEFQSPSSLLPLGSSETRKCAVFGAGGEVFLTEMRRPGTCYSTSQGHFSIVIPAAKKKKLQPSWIVGLVAGFVVVGMAGIVGVRSLFCNRRNQEMEKEGECLQSDWIGSSKMPRAQVTRTQPVLESTALPNLKMSWYA